MRDKSVSSVIPKSKATSPAAELFKKSNQDCLCAPGFNVPSNMLSTASLRVCGRVLLKGSTIVVRCDSHENGVLIVESLSSNRTLIYRYYLHTNDETKEQV